MDQNPKPTSVLESIGEEIIRIIAPVSICMFLVVLLVSILNNSSSSSSSLTIIATIVYNENTSDSIWNKFTGALLYSLAFVALVTVVTFILVFLFYIRCTRFLKIYMGFSACVVLGFMGGEVALFLIRDFNFPIDCFTFLVILFNFTVVGVMSVFMSKMAILIRQGYMVVIGILTAYWFTFLPEWTTWALLVAMALYDIAAVLLPGGPLRILVELAMSRDEDIPALVYEARPVTYQDSGPRGGVVERRLWREKRAAGCDMSENSNSESNSSQNPNFISDSNSTPGTFLSVGTGQTERSLIIAEEGRLLEEGVSELSAPLIERQVERDSAWRDGQEEAASSESWVEGIGLGSSGAIKLGLGDFIFYSVLVGRAAMYDYMTVYACYLAIIAGLGITLMLLAFYQKALPALPVSILLGVLFYFLTRFLLEAFVVQCSVNLLMF